VSTELHLDPELAEIVERARKRAIESGELRLQPPATPYKSPLSDEEKAVLWNWVDSGALAAAIAEIAAEDPELAND
jgi:hypothetical protein